jgi:hypothetical protein
MSAVERPDVGGAITAHWLVLSLGLGLGSPENCCLLALARAELERREAAGVPSELERRVVERFAVTALSYHAPWGVREQPLLATLARHGEHLVHDPAKLRQAFDNLDAAIEQQERYMAAWREEQRQLEERAERRRERRRARRRSTPSANIEARDGDR